MKENSIEEDVEILERFSNENVIYAATVGMTLEKYKDLQLSTEHILSDYKRVLKENEELTISNKEIDKECNRLEEKEVELINQNEHYKDLICALENYYAITEEDLKECMKNDR